MGVLLKFWMLIFSYWGMVLGYVGFVISIIGIILVLNYELECDVCMEVGEMVFLGGYDFIFVDVFDVNGFNYIVDVGVFDVI